MDSSLNAKQIMANIYALAKIRKIKIGDLEKAANVSAGYISRLNNDENTTIPNVEILSAIAWKLLVPLDVLIKSNVSELTGGEQYVLRLINKLTMDTVDDKLEWAVESKTDLNKELTYAENAQHPLISLRSGEIDCTSGYPGEEAFFKSEFLDGEVEINGNCYKASIPFANAEMYLMNIAWDDGISSKSTDKKAGLEMYMLRSGNLEPICSSEDNDETKVGLAMLYKNIMDMRENMGLTKKTRTILDHYLNEEPELPF